MMEDSNRSYTYLLEIFGENCLRERFELIHGKAISYLKNSQLAEFTDVNEYIVDEILLDYYSDISRLKDFHNIERAQPKKVAAYTSYWVQRRKPIQLLKDLDNDTIKRLPQIQWINENYAISLLISMSFDTLKPLAMDFTNFNVFIRSLRYYFRYRQLNAQMLELVLNALDVSPIYEPLI